MKANIKLPIWLPIFAILISVLVGVILGLTILSGIIFLGSVYLLCYYTLGTIRKEDALMIEDGKVKVQSPFRYREWDIENLKKIYLLDNNSILKGIYYDEVDKEVTLITNIYDVDLLTVAKYLFENYPKLEEKEKED